MENVLTDVSQMTPVWLTRLLQTRGILTSGEVSTVQVIRSQQTNVSWVYHLGIDYIAGHDRLPRRLFLKLPNPELAWIEKEVEFYQVLAPAMQSTAADHAWLFPAERWANTW